MPPHRVWDFKNRETSNAICDTFLLKTLYIAIIDSSIFAVNFIRITRIYDSDEVWMSIDVILLNLRCEQMILLLKVLKINAIDVFFLSICAFFHHLILTTKKKIKLDFNDVCRILNFDGFSLPSNQFKCYLEFNFLFDEFLCLR